jgi:hypothetical protein
MNTKYRLAAGLAAVLLVLASCQKGGIFGITVPTPSYWPTEGWQVASPEAAGFRSDKLADGLLAILSI